MRIALVFMGMFLGVSFAAHASCVNPAGAPGDFFYNEDHRVFQGCTADGWYAFTTPHFLTDPCLAPGVTPGTVCASGAVYAGQTPDGNVPMYTTPADHGERWNNGNGGTTYTQTNLTSFITGEANTAALITLDSDNATGGVQPHRAAQYCADLVAHGHSAWYLPARDELNVLRTNRVAIGGFDLSGVYPDGQYWSSTENSVNHTQGINQRFSDGAYAAHVKQNWMKMRCVTKNLAPAFGPPVPCANPAAPIGSVFYNIDHRVFQGCTHFGWQAFHEPAPGPAQPESADTCVNPTGKQGATFYNQDYKVFQGCTANGWYAFHDPCDGNPTPGTRCDDGTIYAGLTPDGNVKMFTTPTDAGRIAWNDANTTGYTTTGQTSNVTGQANTIALIGLDSDSGVGGMQPHRAAQHCADLVAYGHDDWYMPARNELSVLWTNRTAIGGFNLTHGNPGAVYWSSSEDNNNHARTQRFSDGGLFATQKHGDSSVRCVRKGS